MSRTIKWRTLLVYASAILLGMVLGQAVAGLGGFLPFGGTRPAIAEAAPAPLQPSGAALAADQAADSLAAAFTCAPAYVGVLSNRIHVLCAAPAPGGIWYFAAPTADSKAAARILSAMLTAKAMGKNLQIYYNPLSSGASFGCLVTDCRPIEALEVMP